MYKTNAFSGNPLNRLHSLRSDDGALEKIINVDKNVYFVPFHQNKPLLSSQHRRVLWQGRDAVQKFLPSSNNLVLLGERESKYYVAVDVNEPAVFGDDQVEMGEYVNLREAAMFLPADEAAILAQAKALIEWNQNHRYCGSCGSATISSEGGVKRVCSNEKQTCGRTVYPRTDPVVIMLVIHNDKVLLGRKKEWPKGMYSCLAGFVDSGETIEEAVVREVKEEADVSVSSDNVHYFSSQPWPFLGGQIMIGCFAYTSSNHVQVDTKELDEAIWCSREQVKQGLDNCLNMKSTFRLPPSLAIAHMLCKAWVEDLHIKSSL